jgi:hypothetical protein
MRNNGCGGTRTAIAAGVDPVGLVEAVNQGQAERAAEDPGGRRKEQLKNRFTRGCGVRQSALSSVYRSGCRCQSSKQVA